MAAHRAVRPRCYNIHADGDSPAPRLHPGRGPVMIRQTAEEHGLNPDDFLRMAEIESALNPFAYHPVSQASGLFQFLPSTASSLNGRSARTVSIQGPLSGFWH